MEYVGDARSLLRTNKQAAASTKQAVQNIEGSHARLRKSFANVAKAASIGGAAIGAGVAVGLKKSVDAYRESEKSNARLQAQMKSMGASYKAHAKEIDVVIQRTSKLAGLDDEDLQDAFTNVVRSTKNVKAGMKDMSLVADLARAKHMDVAKAGELLAKIHAGNVAPLKRMGVEFTKSTKNVDALREAHKKATPEQLKAAKAADDQANSERALSVLRKRFAGQAEAYGKTGAGASDRMKVATENLQEAIGRGLSPALATVQQKVADFVNGMVEGTGTGGKFRDEFMNAFNGVKAAAQAVWPTVQSGFSWLKENVPRAISAVSTGFNTAKAAISGWIAKARPDLELIGNVIAKVAGVVRTVLGAAFDFAAGVARRTFPAIKQVVQGAVQAITGVINVFMGILHGDWGRVWGGLKGIVSGALKGVLGVIRGLSAPVREAVSRIGSAIGSALSSAGGAIKGAAGKAVGGIVGAIRGVTGKARSAASSVGKGAVEVFHNLGARFVELGKNLIEGLVNGIKSMASKAANAAKDVAKGAVDGVKGFLHIGSPSKLFEQFGRWTIEGYVNGLVDSRGMVEGAVNKSLLFPIDAAIAALNAKKERLQKSWDAIDARAQRSQLVAAVREAGKPRRTTGGSNGGGGAGGGNTGSGVIGGGRFLQGMGLQVGESKYFGGVTTNRHAHYTNDHYSGNSIDVNAAGGGASELAKLKTALAKLREKFRGSIQQAMIEDAGTANQHLHVTFKSAGSAAKAVGAKVSAAMGKVATKATGKLTANQMRGLLYAEGFRGHDLDVAVAIGMAESGGKVKATHKNSDGSTDRGFMQINSVHGKMSTTDPRGNAAAAYKLYKQRGGFGDWATFNSGAYKKFMGNTGSGKGSSKGINLGKLSIDTSALKNAKDALKDFDKQAARLKEQTRIDVRVKGLEQLKAFRDAIKGLGDEMKTQASQVASEWRTKMEAAINAAYDVAVNAAQKIHDDTITAIDNGPMSQELARYQGRISGRDDARTIRDLNKNLTDANAAVKNAQDQLAKDGSPALKKQWAKDLQDALDAQKDAQDAIANYEDGKVIDLLQKQIDSQKKSADNELDLAKANASAVRDIALAGLDQQTIDYENMLTDQGNALVSNLAARKITYARFVSDMNKIGLGLPADAQTEATVTAGPGPAAGPQGSTGAHGPGTWGGMGVPKPKTKAKKKRATGGWVYPGMVYDVGELGRETFTPAVPGKITQASQSKASGGVTVTGNTFVVKRTTDIDRVARKLAWEMKTGIR